MIADEFPSAELVCPVTVRADTRIASNYLLLMYIDSRKRSQPYPTRMVSIRLQCIKIQVLRSGRVPPNIIFEVDDVESEWPDRKPFDFIHSRYMCGSIVDWPKLFRQAYKYVLPTLPIHTYTYVHLCTHNIPMHSHILTTPSYKTGR